MRTVISFLALVCILEEWFIKAQNIVGYPGDTNYTITISVPPAPATRNFFPAISPIPIGSASFMQFGTMYSQYGANNTILSCSVLNKGETDFDNVCLLGPSSGAPTDYFLMMFKPVFPGINNAPQMSWPRRTAWQTIKLAAGKNYQLFPTDTKNELFILSSEFNIAANSTTLYFGRIVYDKPTQKLSLALDWTTAPQTLPNFKLEITSYTKICTWITGSLLIFNPLNSTRPYENTTAGQPPNNQMVLLNWDDKLTSKAQVVSLPIITSPSVLPPKPSVTRMPNYIMDVEAVNDLLYVSAIDEEQGSPAKAVVMYLQCDFSDKTPKFVLDSNSGTQPKVVGTVDPVRRPFNHFMALRFSTSLTRIETLLFCHERPSTHDATGRYPIKFHLVSKTGFFMNTNPTFLMRPIEPQAEIKVLKLGIGSYQSNIAYLINGKLVYIDWINYYSIRFESQNVLEETIKVSEAELVRINVGNYPQCWSFFNANTEIANMAKSAKKGYNLMCLQDSIITMMWAGDSTTYAHVVNIPQTGTVPNYNISTYIPFALSGKTSFENAFTSAMVSTTVMGNLFSPIAYKSGSTPKGNVSTQKNSIDIIEFPSDTIIGGDISYSVFNPHPNMTFFFCKVCDMRFVRDPQDTAPVVIDDVILFANGGIFEDINKHIGYMTCNDQINFTAKYLQRNCRVTQSVSTGQWRLAQVLDRTTACQSILIAMESKTNSSRKFYYYDTKSGTIITVGDFANVDQHQMSCTSTRILIVGWKMSSETPSVVELVFNRAASPPALVTPPNTPTGFGLKGLANIREASFNSTRFVFTRWNNATNILEIETQNFDTSTDTFSRESFVEYRYLPGFGVSWDRVMLLAQHFIPFNTGAPNQNKLLSMFEGETFSANRRYWAKLGLNLEEIGFTTIKKVLPHDIVSISCFSVWGIQSVTVGSSIVEYTLIATFRASTDPRARLFSIYNTSKHFTEVIAMDDNQDEIYFRVKEFQHQAAFIRLVLSGNILTAQYGMFPESSYSLVIRGRNRQSSLDYTVPLIFQSVSKIEVTPVKDLDYKQDLVLSLLPGMASKIVGHVTSIEMGNGTGASIRRNRVVPDTSIPEISVTPIPTRISPIKKILSTSSFGLEAILVDEDQAIYFFRNMKYITKCSIGSIVGFSANGVRQFIVQDSKPSIDKIYVILSIRTDTSNQVLTLVVTGTSTVPRCHPPKKVVVAGVDVDLGDFGKIVMVPNTGTVNGNYGFYIMKIIPSKPIEYSTEVVATAANGDITVSYKVIAMESLLTPNPYQNQNISGEIGTCTYLPLTRPENNSTIQLSLCISLETATNSIGFYTVNHIFSTVAAARVHKLLVPQSQLPAFSDLSKLQCTIQPSMKIICGIMDFYSKVTTIHLVRDTTTGFCATDTKFFCLKVETLQKTYSAQSLVTAQQLALSPDFVVSTIRKKDNSAIMNAFVYLHNQTDPDIFFERNVLNQLNGDSVVFSFFGRSNTLYMFDALTMKMSFFSIGETQLAFSSPSLSSLTAEMVIANHDSSFRLKLSSLFKKDATPATPQPVQPPPATPPKTFWQQYWWAVAGTGVVLLVSAVGYFLYRRELLKQELSKNEAAMTIDSLDEFHYRR